MFSLACKPCTTGRNSPSPNVPSIWPNATTPTTGNFSSSRFCLGDHQSSNLRHVPVNPGHASCPPSAILPTGLCCSRTTVPNYGYNAILFLPSRYCSILSPSASASSIASSATSTTSPNPCPSPSFGSDCICFSLSTTTSDYCYGGGGSGSGSNDSASAVRDIVHI